VVIDLTLALANMVRTTWIVAAVLLYLLPSKRQHLGIQRWLWAELRPFYLPAVFIGIARDVLSGDIIGWSALWDGFALLNWWIYKDIDDDDRWKRRKAKVTGKVKALASGRLTVVPAVSP